MAARVRGAMAAGGGGTVARCAVMLSRSSRRAELAFVGAMATGTPETLHYIVYKCRNLTNKINTNNTRKKR